MKKTVLALVFCTCFFHANASDVQVSGDWVKLIFSLPTNTQVNEWRAWRAKPAAERGLFDPKIDAKIKDEIKNVHELLSQMKIGKSIFDYPGMLSLGNVTWDAPDMNYSLHYINMGENQPIGFIGFRCTFTDAGIIIRIKQVRSYGRD